LTKFYFAISLKSKQNSDNWGLVADNLKQTLISIKNSSCQNYHIVIATNDPEDLERIIDTNRTTLVHADFDAPKAKIQKGASDKHKKRRLIGSYLANIETDPFYVMFLDADDLIHKDLVGHVLSDDNHRGYIVSEGYVLDIAEGELRRKNEFDTICGSCYIGYFYPEEMPKSTDDMECYYSEHMGHRRHIKIATKNGRKPDSIPFPGTIYIRGHEESLQTVKKKWKLHKSSTLKLFLTLFFIEKKIRHLINNMNVTGYHKKRQKANKMLQEKYGLHSPPPLKVIILGKRRLRFIHSFFKKYYDYAYMRLKYTNKI